MPEDEIFATPDGVPVGGSGQTEIWWLQVRADAIRRVLGFLRTTVVSRSFARLFLFLLGIFMIITPAVIFYRFLSNGVLFISPPLFVMFLGGFIGIGLARSEYWE